MIGSQSSQMMPKRSRSPAQHLQMMNAGFWFENYMVAGISPTKCEFRLELIGHTHEVLVEPANCESFVPVEREISSHKVLDFSCSQRSKMKIAVSREVQPLLPWLNNSARNDLSSAIGMGVNMRSNEICLWDDIIIKE